MRYGISKAVGHIVVLRSSWESLLLCWHYSCVSGVAFSVVAPFLEHTCALRANISLFKCTYMASKICLMNLCGSSRRS